MFHAPGNERTELCYILLVKANKQMANGTVVYIIM